jgi:small ligand-binding sensory domain FIST
MDLVNRYAAALSLHPTPVEAVGEVAGEILERFDETRPDLLVFFASPHHVGAFEDVAGGLRKLLEPETMIGCTAVGVAGGAVEVEDGPGLSVLAASFGAGRIDAIALESTETEDGLAISGWPDNVPARGTLLMLADPFSFPVGDFLALCNARVPEVTVVGGLASAGMRPGTNRLVVNDRILHGGAVALMCSDDVPVRAVVSQGCRPIGTPLTVTRAERNLMYELAGQPAMQRLQELVQSSSDDERELMRNGLHLGMVVDEHKLDFARGDFLIRNVLGADQDSGAIAVGDHVDVGTTVQFQVRDADAASEDLSELLDAVTGEAALLFTCNGRGTHLFDVPNHDVLTVEEALGAVPLAGAFCAGEIGPIGGHNFLHGFTASVAIFER